MRNGRWVEGHSHRLLGEYVTGEGLQMTHRRWNKSLLLSHSVNLPAGPTPPQIDVLASKKIKKLHHHLATCEMDLKHGVLPEDFFTKASEASWSYSCDSKVSFDRVQILTPDFSGRRPPPTPPPPPHLPSPHLPSPHLPSPHLPPSPPPCLPPIFPPSLLPLRKFDSVLSSLFGMRLALRILRPHSLTLTLTLSLSHCLSHLSHLSHLFLISLISLSSLSPLSLSLLSVSRLSVSLLSLFSRRRIRAKSHI